MSGQLVLDQAVYGSRSGEADFQILAASPGWSRDERDAFLHASNLGGSAQTAADPSPIYAFYPLGPASRRWGFCRTLFLGRGGRGNDYLAHVVVLSSEVLGPLRGDVFLLEELGLFLQSKPEGESLPPLVVDRDRVEHASRRALGSGQSSPGKLAPVLRDLARGPLALEVGSGAEGAELCRSVVACLPPDDRAQLSFCSRFSLPRGMSFRLAAYRPADRGLAQRHLAGFGVPLPNVAVPAPDPVAEWLDRLALGVEPLSGLSLLERPVEALSRVAAISSALRGGSPSGESLDPMLLPLVLEPRNRPLGTRSLLAAAVFGELRRRVTELLAGTAKVAELVAACAAVRERETAQGFGEELSAVAERRVRRRDDLADLTTGIVAALLISRPARLVRVHGGRASLLATAHTASQWITELEEANPAAALELLTTWFTHWRLVAGARCLAGVVAILPTLTGPGAVRAVLGALEAAAPPSGDPERSGWFLALLREVRPRSGALFPPLHAARLAAQEGLLGELSARERVELVPALAAELPEMASELITHGTSDYGLLSELVAVCQQGLLGHDLEGGGWDVAVRPALWDLAARVAEAGAAEAGRRRDATVLTELAWLVWAASRLVAGRGAISWPTSPQADQRFAGAVAALLKAAPAGASDVVLRAAYRFARFGPGLGGVEAAALAQFRRQAWRDAHRQSPHPGFRLGTLLRLVWLDRHPPSEVLPTP